MRLESSLGALIIQSKCQHVLFIYVLYRHLAFYINSEQKKETKEENKIYYLRNITEQ